MIICQELYSFCFHSLTKRLVSIIKKDGKTSVMTRKNAAAVELGRRGGKARMTTMTPEERKKIARKAIKARWDKEKKKGE
jgi:hypothetical protein